MLTDGFCSRVRTHTHTLTLASEALDADAKNYHAWAHRQVVVAASGTWQQEMDYLEKLLQQDVRNNSAWNQRAFVVRVSERGMPGYDR